MCCSNENDEKDINGICIDCGLGTIDGEPYEMCYYSPVYCETCGAQPCDGSC